MYDFEIAKTWHQFFARHVELVADGIIDEPLSAETVCDDAACKLGKWLHGPAHVMHDLPAYAGLVKAHRQFHQCAGELLRAAQGETSSGTQTDVAAYFKAISLAVTDAIDRLLREFEATSDRRHYVSPFVDTDTAQGSWSDSLLVGIPAIDEQHKAVIRIFDRLYALREAPIMSASAVDSLTELGKILDLHFTFEETILKRCGMPRQQVDEHLAKHGEMLEQYAQINLDAMGHCVHFVRDITDAVRTWAVDHVILYDMQLKKYARQTAML